MKVNFNGLKPYLKHQTPPISLIFGDEPWQKEQALETVKSHFKQLEFNDIERQTFDKSIDDEWFYRSVDNLSLFGDKTLVIIRFNQIPDEKSKKILTEYAESIKSTSNYQTAIILVLPHLNTQQQKQKWFKAIESSGLIIPIWPLTRVDVKRLIDQISQEKKLTLMHHAKEKLIDYTEGNFLATAQTLEKLAIFSDQSAITEHDIDEIISTNSHYDVYALSDAFLNGNLKKTLVIINQLKHAGTELVLLLWALSQDIRILLQCKNTTDPITLEALFKKHKIWHSRKVRYQNALRQYSISDLRHKLKLCHQTDLLLKSYQTESAWQKLISIILSKHLAD